MKALLNSIKSLFTANKNSKEFESCNYSNNYYGDQYCQPKN